MTFKGNIYVITQPLQFPSNTTLGLLRQTNQISNFLSLLNMTGLTGNPLTILAPLDSAFSAYPSIFWTSIRSPNNSDILLTFLKNHFFNETIFPAAFANSYLKSSLGGQPFTYVLFFFSFNFFSYFVSFQTVVGDNSSFLHVVGTNSFANLNQIYPGTDGVGYIINQTIFSPTLDIAIRLYSFNTLYASIKANGLLPLVQNASVTVFGLTDSLLSQQTSLSVIILYF